MNVWIFDRLAWKHLQILSEFQIWFSNIYVFRLLYIERAVLTDREPILLKKFGIKLRNDQYIDCSAAKQKWCLEKVLVREHPSSAVIVTEYKDILKSVHQP